MALAGLGPWNEFTPGFFTQAMERGAATGLSARAQDTEEASAADRLRLAYEQLGARERQAAEATKVRMKQIDAANALRASQIAAQAQYRADQLSDAAARLTETHRHNMAMETRTKTPTEARIDLPEDTDTGEPKMSGTMADPDIARRVNAKKKAAADALLEAQKPGWFSKGVSDVVKAAKSAVGLGRSGSAEIPRKTKDGRIAIYDANTKQFLRYAESNMGGNGTTDNKSE